MNTKVTFAALVVITSLAVFTSQAAEMHTPIVKKSGQEIEVNKAREAAETLNSVQKSKLLNLLNKGTEKELAAIKGIATGRANAVIKERPFTNVEEIVKVRGIGLSTFARIIDFGKNPPVTKTAAKSE